MGTGCGLFIALLVAVIGALFSSSKAQSLLVFVHWVNWPPFEWSDPSKPSSQWVQALSSFTGQGLSSGAFAGLPSAVPISTPGEGGTLRGWRIPRVGAGECVVLYLHGNAGNIAVDHRVRLYRLLAELHCDVVAIDYRGFGFSDGRWSDEASAIADALAMYRSLPGHHEEVIVWGHSLGTGISLGLMEELLKAEMQLPSGLVLEAPFLSVPEVATSFVLAILPDWLCSSLLQQLESILVAHHFSSKSRIGSVAKVLPVSILHGRQDAVVPFWHGQELAKLGPAEFQGFDQSHDGIVMDPSLPSILSRTFEAWLHSKPQHSQSATV
mmetsp:Transcript_19401/g.43673  ORF Transcript_19401/g.43673 Transcript_19401/m.43673 type:complete len:325 (-) Transcript_19401:30-1004(-)|eukprot:6465374-Amphidinium_carterae.1